jgi:manganese transport protein
LCNRTEVAVIASDVPEVIGTAFALKILFGLPLWIGVVITAIDTLIFLAVNFFGVRMLELVIGLFVAVISVSFVIEVFGSGSCCCLHLIAGLHRITKIWLGAPAGLVFEGFIPRMSGSAAYTAVSLLGAVVMPHNLFLHSALVGSRKFGKTDEKKKEAILYNGIESGVSLAISLIINVSVIVGV